MGGTAKRVALATLIVIAIVATALALWKLKLVLADWLRLRGVPNGVGILVHYLAIAGLIALFLWIVVPRAVDQVQNALGGSTKAQIQREATKSKGLKHEVLTAVDKRLRKLPKAGELLHPAVQVTPRAFEALLGILFVLATAAYWIFEKP